MQGLARLLSHFRFKGRAHTGVSRRYREHANAAECPDSHPAKATPMFRFLFGLKPPETRKTVGHVVSIRPGSDTPRGSGRKFRSFVECDASIKVWLPERIEVQLAELADMHECSESEIVRTLLFIHLYGLADFEAMRLQQQGWFMPRPPKRGSVGRDIGIKYSRTLNSFPELGKNIHAFRLWFPDVMKQDLQKLAAKDGKLLSPYVRVLLIRQLLGEAYQHDAGEWVAPQGSEEAEKE